MTNRSVLEAAFTRTAQGDGRGFIAMLAADVRWTIIGSTPWSRTFVGKQSVIDDLLRPLSAQFQGQNVVTAERIIEAGDLCVVEGSNHSRTVCGDPYPNRYCWVFQFREGQVTEITEYCDTALVERVLGSPDGRERNAS